jgi:nucleotide-binding universal stress UspA family protein
VNAATSSATQAAAEDGAAVARADQILVGVDGSAASIGALRWSTSLVDRSGQAITAVYAFIPTYSEMDPDQYQVARAEAERALVGWCAETGRSVETLVVGGGPGALLTMAEAHQVLLVVGTSGASGFARLQLGSVANHLAHHTSTPLGIVPIAAARDGVARIVIGVDGSQGCAAAVEFCARLASRVGATVVAVHAIEPHRAPVPERPGHDDPTSAVHEWIAPIEAAAVPVTVEVKRGLHPVEALCRAIERAPNTLAVVGTRGLGGFSGLRLGGVALHLVHSTRAAVVMVPAPPDLTEQHLNAEL